MEYIFSMKELWYTLRIFLLGLSHPNKRNRLKRYGFSLILILTVFTVKFFLFPFLGQPSSFILLTLAVAICSWFGGFGPGIFTTILSAFLNYKFFLSLDIATHLLTADWILTLIFILEGLIISIMSEAKFEAEMQKDEFIAMAGHELKNPLSAIKGYAGLIINNTKKKNYKKVFGFAKEIDEQSDKLLDLINYLLDITKIEIGKFNYKPEAIFIGGLVKKIVEHQRVVGKGRIIDLNISSHKIIRGDRYRISQVIVNLISNALKYSSKRQKVKVSVKDKKSSIIIAVKDFGRGITKNEQSKIFRPYYRSRRAQKEKEEGLGLGLYICSKIVKEHEGKLWMVSKEGKGTAFYVELPIRQRKHL